MAVLSTTLMTLVEWGKRLAPDGGILDIAELLAQTNEVLTDMPFQEGNLPTGHRVGVRTGLPTATWRLLNQGVAASRSTTAQIDEQCGMLEARGQIDVDLATLNGNLAAFRLSEATPHMEAMNQEMAQTLFYGNSGLSPEEFTGLSPRYSALTGAGNISHVINGGGTGAATKSSVWLLGWGAQGLFGIYPKGSQAGLLHKDLGEGDAFDASNNRFRAYMDLWQWKCGIALKDWRYAVRICNIDIPNLVAQSSATDLIEAMIKAIHRLPFINMVRPVFYMNRTVFEFLDIQRRGDVIAGGGLRYENVDGVATSTFRGIPVRKVDALIETEAVVV